MHFHNHTVSSRSLEVAYSLSKCTLDYPSAVIAPLCVSKRRIVNPGTDNLMHILKRTFLCRLMSVSKCQGMKSNLVAGEEGKTHPHDNSLTPI